MQSTGGGLARFQSVPAAWLEALLLSDEDIIIDPPKSTFNQPFSVTTTGFVDSNLILPGSDNGFLRQNSSPVEFVSHVNNSDEYISGFGVPVKAGYDGFVSSGVNVKRFRDDCLDEESKIELTTQMSGDQSGLMDIEMEKIVPDSGLLRVRAKRGFATHPRSIAERVRRTRISDRIRKLQELVPNMDKQTNTADMLDEAVEYVKFLQNQIQDLTQHQNKCICFI